MVSARAILLVTEGPFDDTKSIADIIFARLPIEHWEERFSSNYPPEERYFRGGAESFECEVFRDDYEGVGWIIHLLGQDSIALETIAGDLARTLLVPLGARVERVHKWGRLDETRESY